MNSLNSKTRFSNRVEDYIKYRPGYPDEVLHHLVDQLGLKSSDVIADVGSGTGISSRLFAKNGNKVFGIEPNEAMRRASEEALKDFGKFSSVPGSAEATGLPDHSVDWVFAAQAFHWFDPSRSRAEFQRIIKPEGYCIFVWNERLTKETPFLEQYEDFLQTFSTDYNRVKFPKEKQARSLSSFFGTQSFDLVEFSYQQDFDLEGLKGRVFSSSYVPDRTSPRAGEMTSRLHELFHRFQVNNQVQIKYATKLYFGKI